MGLNKKTKNMKTKLNKIHINCFSAFSEETEYKFIHPKKIMKI